MLGRKEIKRLGRGHLKRNYIFLVLLCSISIFLGTEYTRTVENAQLWYDTLAGNVTQVNVAGTTQSPNAMSNVVSYMIEDNLEQGREETAAAMQEMQNANDADSVLGRRRGVLAALVNTVNSGHMYALIGTALVSIFHSEQWTAVLMIIGAMLLQLAIWVLIRNFYSAVLRRSYLESRTYEKVPLSHMFYFQKVRRWIRASLTLFLEAVFEVLWWLTVIGGAIKRYSYYMVPYIVAENPDIKPREAIRLSRRMMDGHKWECFKMSISFLGWDLLGFVTFGAGTVLWAVPYRMAAFTEYYAQLRDEAKEKNIPGCEKLNDEYLFGHAAPGLLEESYSRLAMLEDIIEEDIIELDPKEKFWASNFGIWIKTLKEKIVYSRQIGLRQETMVARLEMNGRAYPERLNSLWKKNEETISGKVSYLSPCTVWSLIIIFFAFCFVGWIWEVSLHIMTDGTFVNRGALHGPWLPIYGSGVTMIAILLYRFRSKPAVEAVLVTVLCGFVEYFSSFFMELSSGLRWWDYTGYFLNLNGRICGEGLAVFTVGGMAAVYLLVPVIDELVIRIKPKVLIPVCLVLLALFCGDLVYSHYYPNTGEGITDYEAFKSEETEESSEPAADESTGFHSDESVLLAMYSAD